MSHAIHPSTHQLHLDDTTSTGCTSGNRPVSTTNPQMTFIRWQHTVAQICPVAQQYGRRLAADSSPRLARSSPPSLRRPARQVALKHRRTWTSGWHQTIHAYKADQSNAPGLRSTHPVVLVQRATSSTGAAAGVHGQRSGCQFKSSVGMSLHGINSPAPMYLLASSHMQQCIANRTCAKLSNRQAWQAGAS